MWNNRSDTYVRVVGPDKDSHNVLLVLVANNGGRPALVRGASLVGKELHIDRTELEILDSTQKLILPSTATMLRLSVANWKITTSVDRDQLLKLLPKGEVTVSVEVEETGWFGGRFVRRQSDDAKGALIEELVRSFANKSR